jgi:hypothetical protein
MDARAHQGPVSRRRHVPKRARERRRVWQGPLGPGCFSWVLGALVRTPIKGSGASLPFCPSLFPARADTLSQSFQFRYVIRYAAIRASYLLVQLSFSFAFLWCLPRAYICTTPSALVREESGSVTALGRLLLLARSSSVRRCIPRTVEACCSAHSPLFFSFFCSSLSFVGNPLRMHAVMGKRGSVFSAEWSLARGSFDRSLALAVVVPDPCCRTFFILGINLESSLSLKIEANRPESVTASRLWIPQASSGRPLGPFVV